MSSKHKVDSSDDSAFTKKETHNNEVKLKRFEAVGKKMHPKTAFHFDILYLWSGIFSQIVV